MRGVDAMGRFIRGGNRHARAADAAVFVDDAPRTTFKSAAQRRSFSKRRGQKACERMAPLQAMQQSNIKLPAAAAQGSPGENDVFSTNQLQPKALDRLREPMRQVSQCRSRPLDLPDCVIHFFG